MLHHNSCRAIVLACCLAASGAASAWPDPTGLSGKAPGSEGCEPASMPCLQLWSEMSAAERAKLWPYLDEASKTSYWRGMSKEERRDLRSSMSARDQEALRRRFSIDARGEGRQAKRPKLCREDMRLMREQILEVHMQHHEGAPAAHRGAKDLHGSAVEP